MAPLSVAHPVCTCNGREHVVCRRWSVLTAKDTLAQFSAPISDPPARAKLYDCGCHGRSHPVCDPRFLAVRERPTVAPAKRMTVKQALKEGLRLRPHVTHTFRCDAGDDERHVRCTFRCDCGEMGPGRPAVGAVLDQAA